MRTPTRTTKPLVAPLLAVAVLLTATACNDDKTSPSATQSTPAPSTPPTTPTTPSTTSTKPATPPPTIPAAATKGLTVTSAEAFARFYLAAVDHLVGTGDGTLMRRWSDKGCEACNGLLSAYESTYKNGGSVVGDAGTRILRVEETRLIRRDTAAVLIKAAEGRHEWRKKAGATPTIVPGGPFTLDTTLAARSGHWVMYEMVMKK